MSMGVAKGKKGRFGTITSPLDLEKIKICVYELLSVHMKD